MKKSTKVILAVIALLTIAYMATMNVGAAQGPGFIVGGQNIVGLESNPHPGVPPRIVPAGGARLNSVTPWMPGQIVHVWAVKAPQKNDPNYLAKASAIVQAVDKNGQPDAADMLAYTNLTQAADFIQPSALNSNDIWFATMIETRTVNDRYHANKLRLAGTSSDSHNYLATSSSLDADPNYVWGPTLIGRIYNDQHQSSVSDAILASASAGKLSATAVDKISFIGEQVPWFVADSGTSQYTSVSNYLVGVPNFQFVATITLLDDNNVELTHACKTIAMKYWPVQHMPRVIVKGDMTTEVTINGDPYNSELIYYTTALQGQAPFHPQTQWTLLGHINPNQAPYKRTTVLQEFYKIVPQ